MTVFRITARHAGMRSPAVEIMGLRAIACVLFCMAHASAADDIEARRSVDRAHGEIWRRFIGRSGLFYDYTGLDGAVNVPEPQECANCMPNALGWWTPIENGAFFGGLYLDGLCSRWREIGDTDGRDKARKVADGLLSLARVGDAPGFVARGFATDGKGHYPVSSSDQTYPWFYGLWRYATSGIPDEAERRRIADALARVALGLESNDWKMPCDRKGFGHFGHWTGGFAGTRGTLTGAEPQFDAASRLLFVLRALHHLTGGTHWLDRYRRRLVEAPHGSQKSRLEICSQGVQYVGPGESPKYPESPPIWTSASSQAGLRALFEMEDDALTRAEFQKGLRANAMSAAKFISRYRGYDNETSMAFDIDWRALNKSWKPQAEIGEAVELATLQYRAWNKMSPKRVAEAERMRDPLFAAWIVALSGDEALIASAREDIRGSLLHYRWERLHTCVFFMAECVYWRLYGHGAPSTFRSPSNHP